MPLRPATAADRDRLFALLGDERVAASLSRLAGEELAEAIDRTDGDGGALVIEAAAGEAVGVACWSTRNRRSRIAGLHTIAVDPSAQQRGHALAAVRALTTVLVRERAFHRVEAETYGFNHAARRVFLAAGYSEEGIRRRAYDRHGAWQDGVLFGLLAEEL